MADKKKPDNRVGIDHMGKFKFVESYLKKVNYVQDFSETDSDDYLDRDYKKGKGIIPVFIGVVVIIFLWVLLFG